MGMMNPAPSQTVEITISDARCTRCSRCVITCPRGLLARDGEREAEAIVEEVEPGEIIEEIAIALPEPLPASSQTVFYDCAGREVEATYINAGDISLATLQIGEDFVVASNVIAASGARYSGGQYIWWVKGNQADLVDFRNGGMEAVITCQAQ